MRRVIWRLLQEERGMTYLESMLSMAITAIVLGTVVMTIYQFNVVTRMQGDTLSTSQQMDNLATILNHDVVSATEGSVSGDGTVLTLSKVKHEFNSTADPITSTVQYSLSGRNLARQEGGDTQNVARLVHTVDFGPDGPLSRTVVVTVTTGITRGQEIESMSTVLQFERRPGE